MDTNNTTPESTTTPSSTPPPAADPAPVTPPTEATPAIPPAPAPTPEPMPADKPTDLSHEGTPAVTQPSPAGSPPPATPPVHKKGKGMIWVIAFLVVAFICGLFIAAWYFQTQLQKVTPEKQAMQSTTETPKKFVVGTDGTFQPMEYSASGEATLVGYDIDLGNRIGSELGSTVEFKNIPWDNIFKALDDKQVDMIMSSVTITDERKLKYDFSDNYLNAGQVIIVRKDNTTIMSAETLQGKKIAVQEGTTNEAEALKHTAPTLVIRYPDFVQATQALVDGKADAILSDLPGAKGIILANPTLRIASDPLTNEYYGIVFRKGDPNVKKINEVLSSLRTKGILTDLKQKWLD